MIKIIVAGSKGKMGGNLLRLAKSSTDFVLAGEVDRDDSLDKVIDSADVVIDFTTAQAAAGNATLAAKHKKPIVIGTTGFSEEEERVILEASRVVPVVKSPNMSIGVNVMWKLVETAAHTLGKQFKVDIVETHHIHKLDRPSGTAKKILNIVLTESGRDLEQDVFFYNEEAPEHTDNPDVDISMRSVRRGEVVGDHVIHFTSPGETLSIRHNASSRDIFAEGALAAARWIVGKPAGLYSMDDVLGLN